MLNPTQASPWFAEQPHKKDIGYISAAPAETPAGVCPNDLKFKVQFSPLPMLQMGENTSQSQKPHDSGVSHQPPTLAHEAVLMQGHSGSLLSPQLLHPASGSQGQSIFSAAGVF